MKDKGIK